MEGDEGVDALEAGVAASIGEGGVDGEGFLEPLLDGVLGVDSELACELDVGDPEVSALVAEAAGV